MKRKINICDILKILRIVNDLSIKQLSYVYVSYIAEVEKGKKLIHLLMQQTNMQMPLD